MNKGFYEIKISFSNGEKDTFYIQADSVKDAEDKVNKHIEKHWKEHISPFIKAIDVTLTTLMFN